MGFIHFLIFRVDMRPKKMDRKMEAQINGGRD